MFFVVMGYTIHITCKTFHYNFMNMFLQMSFFTVPSPSGEILTDCACSYTYISLGFVNVVFSICIYFASMWAWTFIFRLTAKKVKVKHWKTFFRIPFHKVASFSLQYALKRLCFLRAIAWSVVLSTMRIFGNQ